MIAHETLIQEAYNLKPLPATATRLAAVVGQPDWDIDEVVQVVQLDPALTGHLLRVANSAMSGTQCEIANIDEAVMRVGPGMVLGLAMGAGVRKDLDRSVGAYGLGEGELWGHSVCSAVAADAARRYCGVDVPHEAFPAALLHDVGKQVLGGHIDPVLLKALEKARSEGCASDLEAESEILDVNHSELGGLVAQHWKLPSLIVRGITYHHNPDDAPDNEDNRICYAVCLADLVATRIGYGAHGREVHWDDHPGVLQNLDTTPERLDQLCTDVLERIEDVLRAYG